MEKNEFASSVVNHLDEGMKGVDSYLFKYGIPEMLYENRDVLERIINGVKAKYGDVGGTMLGGLGDVLTETRFMQCTAFIIATTFVEKIDLFFAVSIHINLK